MRDKNIFDLLKGYQMVNKADISFIFVYSKYVAIVARLINTLFQIQEKRKTIFEYATRLFLKT